MGADPDEARSDLVTGVAGVFDPAGVDPGLVRDTVARVAPHRGALEVRTFAGWVVVAPLDDATGPDIGGSPGLLAMDGRLDGVLGSGGSDTREGASTRLARGLREPDLRSLDEVVGEFALCHVDPRGTATLTRDASGIRPLFWAGRGDRIGFASDVDTLRGLGLCGDAIDHAAVRSLLVNGGEYGERTCYPGVHRVVPGCWVRLEPGGRTTGGRWFRPEDVPVERGLTLPVAARRVRDAVVRSVADRARGHRVALWLSSGRDSAAVAVALAEAGIEATCFTYSFPGCGVESEAPFARELARSLGHTWREIEVSPRVDPVRATELADLVGRPVHGVTGPIQLAAYDAIRTADADVVMSGEMGDLLFAAFPVALLDLLRRGHLRAFARGVRAFDERWMYGYGFTSKVLLRALAPRWVLARRERTRARPPWQIQDGEVRVRAERSDAEYLRSLLIDGAEATESPERLFAHAGARLSWPLADRRVVDVALRLSPELRLPIPVPKPVLEDAFLRDHAGGLVKASIGGYVDRLVAEYVSDFPSAFGPGSLAARNGLVMPSGLTLASDPRWRRSAADLAGLEMWLRLMEERDGT